MFPMLNFRIIGACVRVRCTLQIRQWYDVNWISKIEEGLLLGFRWQYAKKCCCETWCQSECRWPTLATVPSNELCSKSSTFGKTPKYYREDRYITNMALRQRTTTARRLRDNLRTATGTQCLIKPYAIVWEPIIYAAVARLFDHHSYHVTERPDVIGARFICGGNVFSGVEWCSLMNPGLVSSSTTVGFVSTDVLGSASLTLTIDNVTGSVVAASWVVGSILHGVDPLSYFSFQSVLHDISIHHRTPSVVDGNLTGIRYLNLYIFYIFYIYFIYILYIFYIFFIYILYIFYIYIIYSLYIVYI